MTGRADVVVVSTRAAVDQDLDRTGPVIASWLAGRGFDVEGPVVIADGGPVAEAVRRAIDAGSRVVVTTGGTGITPTDRTPEAVAPLLELELPGILEEVRRRGTSSTPNAVLSRGVAGLAGGALVVTLPGSPGAVADGLHVLDGVLDHVLAQVKGTGHEPRRSESHATTVLQSAVVERAVAVESLSAVVGGDAHGAVVTFAGVVRDHDGGRGVAALEYEAHPNAASVLAEVAASVAAAFPDVRIAVEHRVGALVVGDVALAAAVAAPHRAEAFAACGALVDRVKELVPIWKHQRFTDGSDEWVQAL